MASFQAKSATPAQPVSTGRSLTEEIETQELLTKACFTRIDSRVDEHRRIAAARLRSARQYRSLDNLREAQAALARTQKQFDPILGPSRVRSLP